MTNEKGARNSVPWPFAQTQPKQQKNRRQITHSSHFVDATFFYPIPNWSYEEIKNFLRTFNSTNIFLCFFFVFYTKYKYVFQVFKKNVNDVDESGGEWTIGTALATHTMFVEFRHNNHYTFGCNEREKFINFWFILIFNMK